MRNYILIGILYMSVFALYGQDYTIRKYGIEEGLPSSRLNAITQATDGTIWFSTRKGVCWYDANSFHEIPFQYEQKRITTIYKGQDNIIWIGTFGGLYYYDLSTGHEFLSPVKINEHETIGTYTLSIDQDSTGLLWVATPYGYYWYNHKTGEYKQYSENILEISGNYSRIECLSLSPDQKTLWLASVDSLVYTFDIETEQLSLCAELTHIGKARFFEFERDSVLWYATTEKGIYTYNLESKSIVHYTRENSPLVSNAVMSLHISDDKIFIGTDGSGLSIFNVNTQTWETLNKENLGISNNKVHAVYLDRDDNIWLGHYMGGVTYISKFRTKFRSIIYNENKSLLSFNLVNDIEKDKDGNTWIANDEGGVLKIAKNGTIETYKNELKANFSNGFDASISLHEDYDGNMWIGNFKGGVSVINKKTGIVTNSKSTRKYTSIKTANDIRDITHDKDGNMWLSTLGTGVYKLKGNSFEVANILTENAPGNYKIKSDWTRRIEIDGKNRLWICGLHGIDVFSLNEDKVITSSVLTHAMLQAIDYPYDIAFTPQSEVIIASNNGVFIWNEKMGDFNKIDLGIENYEPSSVIVVERNLWIPTTNGLFLYELDTEQHFMFNKSDGLPDNLFIRNSYYYDSTGELLVGSTNGFASFYFDRIILNTKVPEVIFTDLQILNKPTFSNSLNAPIACGINYADEIVLKNEQNIFSIGFAALNYYLSDKNQFKYKLEGFDNAWLDGSTKKATYMNLNPGEYTFRVIASNNDGYWNEKGKSIKIKVLPPWWNSLWFRLLLFFMITSTLIAIVQIRERANKRRTKHLNRLVDKRTRIIKEQADNLKHQNQLLLEQQEELKMTTHELKLKTEILNDTNHELEKSNHTKNRLLSIIAHDIKNPFGVVLNMSELLNDRFYIYDDGKKKLFVERITHASKSLYSMLDNLLNWTRTQEKKIQYNPQKIELNDTLRLILEQNTLAIQDKHIKIIEQFNNSVTVFADINLLQVIIRNVLGNAIKFTPEGGDVFIAIENIKDSCHIRITDTGIGIPNHLLKKLFTTDNNIVQYGTNNEQGSGLGLVVCKEFVEICRGSISITSDLGVGTEIEIILPASPYL